MIKVFQDLKYRYDGGGIEEALFPSVSAAPTFNIDYNGTEQEGQEFVKRQTGGGLITGTGVATIKKIKGNSIVWNQLLGSSDASATAFGITTEMSNGLLHLSGTPSGTSNNSRLYISGYKNIENGHKVLFVANTENFQFRLQGTYSYIGPSQNWRIYTSNGIVSDVVFSTTGLDTTVNYDDYVYLQIFDLTQMFGAGKEPTSLEDFRKLYPLDYYEHNDGTLLSNIQNGFRSKDANNNLLSIISVPVTTMTGKTIGSSTSITIFPDGLKGFGSTKDEIDLDTKKAIKRIGSRAYTSGDESDTTVLTDLTNTYYVLDTPIEYTLDDGFNVKKRYITDANGVATEVKKAYIGDDLIFEATT